jgi:hypothetical protein
MRESDRRFSVPCLMEVRGERAESDEKRDPQGDVRRDRGNHVIPVHINPLIDTYDCASTI